ncbi:MAG: cytochrome c maturation protein CcmE [Fimbriimonadaceae bacterium]|nr:cytochrome c maturation protein CcmE [Fimbriimonadaceae bacterium]
MMKSGSPLGIVAGIAAISGIAFLMLSNASPYVSVKEALNHKGNNLHLQGDLVKESIQVSLNRQETRFTIVDDAGDKMNVVHAGLPPSNMGDATRVVVVGGMANGEFSSHKLITKCPSKYESEAKPSAKASS